MRSKTPNLDKPSKPKKTTIPKEKKEGILPSI